jgi:acyl carrier protein
VNRRLLPGPGIKVSEEYAAPRDDTERKLVEIWSGILNIDKDKIGIDANFFQLGGHSLKATILTSKIHKALNVKIPLAEIFKTQTIRGLSEIIKKSAKETFVEIRPVPVKDHYELSFNQKRLWIMQQTNPDSNFFNMMGHIVIKEPVDETLIKQTVGTLIKMHESLRTGFKEVSGKAVQYIIDTYDIPFDAADISPVQESEKQSRFREIIDEFNKAPFRLDKPPLFKSLLVNTAPGLHVLVYNMHHIVSDGWSMEIIERDFHRIHRAYRENPGGPFEVMDRERDRLTYKDFSHWHNRQLENDPGKEISREFWIRFLEEKLPVLRLPGAPAGRENTREKKGAGYRFVIPGNIKDALKDLSKTHNITLFSLMYSTYIIFLSNISGQPVVVSSIVNAGRDHPSLHHIVGFFVNAVLFKKEINRDAIFIDFAGEVQASVLEFFKYQNYPLELVLDEVGSKYPEVAASFNMLNIGNNETVTLENPGPSHELETQNVKFDIEPFVSEYRNGIEINVSYNRNLLKAENIEYMMEKYRKLIEFFALNPLKKLKDYKEEKKRRSFKKHRRVQ